MRSSRASLKKSREVFLTFKQQKHNCTFLSHLRKDSQAADLQQASEPLPQLFCLGTAVFLSSYLQPLVKNCRHVIGSHAPIIGWAETAQLEEHYIINVTFDTEALYPSVQVCPGVGGLCLFDDVERAIPCCYSLEPDLVEFLVRLLHLVLSTQLTQFGGSFFEVTWGLSIGLQCACEMANLYLDMLDSHVWQGSGWCSQVSLPVH